MSDWDSRFMRLALWWAQECSKDPSTKVGAVLVGTDRRDVALGYNGFPAGINDDNRLLDKDMKYALTVHAERNVIDNAHFDVRGGTLYCTQIPCTRHGCALSVISKGIARVVCPPFPSNEPWASDALLTQKIFKEACVQLDTLHERHWVPGYEEFEENEV